MTNAPLSECVFIVNVGKPVPSMFTYCLPDEAEAERERAEQEARECVESYARHIVNHPKDKEYWQSMKEQYEAARYEVMSYEEFQRREREALLKPPMEPVTEEQYNDALDVLPPLYWVTCGGVEEFCMREMWTGSYTTQYAHVLDTDQYYSKMVDCRDKSTWIHNILAKQREEMENDAASA